MFNGMATKINLNTKELIEALLTKPEEVKAEK